MKVFAKVLDFGGLIQYKCPFCQSSNTKSMANPEQVLMCDTCQHGLHFIVRVVGEPLG